jgi:hypothetical protein
MLDYSAHDVEASKGWVSFRIKPVNGLLANTNIPNRASIYFDFNPAVVTNTAVIRLIDGSGNTTSSIKTSKGIKLFPNPAADRLTIEAEHLKGDIVIYNLHGIHVLTQTVVDPGKVHLNIGHLSSGMYFLVIGKETVKFIVE